MGRIAFLLTFPPAPLVAGSVSSGPTNSEIAHALNGSFGGALNFAVPAIKQFPILGSLPIVLRNCASRGVRNSDLYRDLGNASLLADDLPRAVLSYRRGLAPGAGDPDLQAGLS